MDVIDTLAGIAPGSRMDAVRDGRKVARIHAQNFCMSFRPPVVHVSPTVSASRSGVHSSPVRRVYAMAALVRPQPLVAMSSPA